MPQNQRYFKIIEMAAAVTDQRERLALYRQADKLLIDEALIIPLTYGLEHYLVSPRISKFPKSLA